MSTSSTQPEPEFVGGGGGGGGPAAAAAGGALTKVATTKKKAFRLKGLMGAVSEIAPYLHVGGSSPANDEPELSSRGITHIVNATVNEPNHFPARCVYLKVAVPDVESTDLQRHFARVNDFVSKARSAGGKVYIHCSAGMSRSVSLVMAYLIGVENMALIDAFRLVKSKRSIVAPNPSFMRQLAEYEVVTRGSGAGERSLGRVFKGVLWAEN
jgi:protein-tyrosine phosphatase